MLLALPSLASAATPRAVAPPPYAGQCGLPATQPIWFEFGQTYLEPVFGQAGVVVGASTGDWPSHMRSLGAGTRFFVPNLRHPGGTPAQPPDPATSAGRAERLYHFSSPQTRGHAPRRAFNARS